MKKILFFTKSSFLDKEEIESIKELKKKGYTVCCRNVAFHNPLGTKENFDEILGSVPEDLKKENKQEEKENKQPNFTDVNWKPN